MARVESKARRLNVKCDTLQKNSFEPHAKNAALQDARRPYVASAGPL